MDARPPARPEEQLGDGRSLDVCGLLKDGKHVDGVRQEFKENAEEEEKSADQHAGESRWRLRGGGSSPCVWPRWLRVCGSVIDKRPRHSWCVTNVQLVQPRMRLFSQFDRGKLLKSLFSVFVPGEIDQVFIGKVKSLPPTARGGFQNLGALLCFCRVCCARVHR